MNYDKVCKLKGATIQYGPMNDRIYLMKIADSDPAELLPAMDQLAASENLGKIFAKIPADKLEPFSQAGYTVEARVPLFYNGSVDGIFLAKYFKAERSQTPNVAQLDEVLSIARNKEVITPPTNPASGFSFRLTTSSDAEAMAVVYKEVFASYPFAIHDPQYLRQTMDDNVIYFSIWHDSELVALSSAEMDRENGNVEMTDFATLPKWRGNGFGVFLLGQMQREMARLKMPTSYTIARAVSPGMNITFARLGYKFGGRLINNTQISGNLESMNIWYKPL